MTRYLIAFFAWPLFAFAQDIDRPYELIGQKLSLTEVQMKRLESPRVIAPPSRTDAESRAARRSERSRTGDTQDEDFVGARGVLTPSQDAELRLVAGVLERGQAASEAIRLGLISSIEWPGGGQCFDPDPQYETLGLGLTADQIAGLNRMIDENRSTVSVSDVRLVRSQRRLRELLDAAIPDAGAIHQERTDLKSERSYARKSFLEPAWAILNELQRVRLEAFESELEVASEAVALKLLRAPGGEVFCQ